MKASEIIDRIKELSGATSRAEARSRAASTKIQARLHVEAETAALREWAQESAGAEAYLPRLEARLAAAVAGLDAAAAEPGLLARQAGFISACRLHRDEFRALCQALDTDDDDS